MGFRGSLSGVSSSKCSTKKLTVAGENGDSIRHHPFVHIKLPLYWKYIVASTCLNKLRFQVESVCVELQLCRLWVRWRTKESRQSLHHILWSEFLTLNYIYGFRRVLHVILTFSYYGKVSNQVVSGGVNETYNWSHWNDVFMNFW